MTDTDDTATVEAVSHLHRWIDPVHSMIYFAPESQEELAELGLTEFHAGYFASRSAAMGAVGPGVVTATFGVFSPVLVARFVPAVWSRARPADVLNVRLRAADRALRRLLGDAVGSAEVVEGARLARRACEAASPEARPIYAAMADLPWPDEPHMVLWHAAGLLREYRGDAHVASTAAAGLSGIEALITHTATGRGFSAEAARKGRGWSLDQWNDASARLRERGALGADGALTDAGVALRAQIEETTSRSTLGPTVHLGTDAARLAEIGESLCTTLLRAGAFPEGVFAPGADRSPTRV